MRRVDPPVRIPAWNPEPSNEPMRARCRSCPSRTTRHRRFDRVPVPFPGIIQSLYVREGVPGVGDDSFNLYVGSALYAEYDVTLGNGETGGSAGVAAADAVELTPGAYVQVYCDAAAMGAGSDVVAVLKGITWV